MATLGERNALWLFSGEKEGSIEYLILFLSHKNARVKNTVTRRRKWTSIHPSFSLGQDTVRSQGTSKISKFINDTSEVVPIKPYLVILQSLRHLKSNDKNVSQGC